jgi:hypothetical protein
MMTTEYLVIHNNHRYVPTLVSLVLDHGVSVPEALDKLAKKPTDYEIELATTYQQERVTRNRPAPVCLDA